MSSRCDGKYRDEWGIKDGYVNARSTRLRIARSLFRVGVVRVHSERSNINGHEVIRRGRARGTMSRTV